MKPLESMPIYYKNKMTGNAMKVTEEIIRFSESDARFCEFDLIGKSPVNVQYNMYKRVMQKRGNWNKTMTATVFRGKLYGIKIDDETACKNGTENA